MYKVNFGDDFSFSIVTNKKVLVEGLALCQAIKVCEELNYLAEIVNVIGEEDFNYE